MKKRTEIIVFLLVMFSLAVSPKTYAQATSAQVIQGDQTPELIPNYYAWSTFFWQADHTYRKGIGFYRYFVFNQLGLTELLSQNMEVRAAFLKLLIDEASCAAREEERLKAQREGNAQELKAKRITDTAYTNNNIKYLKEQVSWAKHYKNSFRKKVISLDPIIGPEIVQRIDRVIDTVVKPTISITRFGDDIEAIAEILHEFDSEGSEENKNKNKNN